MSPYAWSCISWSCCDAYGWCRTPILGGGWGENMRSIEVLHQFHCLVSFSCTFAILRKFTYPTRSHLDMHALNPSQFHWFWHQCQCQITASGKIRIRCVPQGWYGSQLVCHWEQLCVHQNGIDMTGWEVPSPDLNTWQKCRNFDNTLDYTHHPPYSYTEWIYVMHWRWNRSFQSSLNDNRYHSRHNPWYGTCVITRQMDMFPLSMLMYSEIATIGHHEIAKIGWEWI